MWITVENFTWIYKTSEYGDMRLPFVGGQVKSPSFEKKKIHDIRWKHEFVVWDLNVSWSKRIDSEEKNIKYS